MAKYNSHRHLPATYLKQATQSRDLLAKMMTSTPVEAATIIETVNMLCSPSIDPDTDEVLFQAYVNVITSQIPGVLAPLVCERFLGRWKYQAPPRPAQLIEFVADELGRLTDAHLRLDQLLTVDRLKRKLEPPSSGHGSISVDHVVAETANALTNQRGRTSRPSAAREQSFPLD